MATTHPRGPLEQLIRRLRVAATKLGRSDEWEDLRDDLNHAAAEIERHLDDGQVQRSEGGNHD